MNNSELYLTQFGIEDKIIDFCNAILKSEEIKKCFERQDSIAEHNQLKVLKAMQDNRLSEIHFAATTGYGYNDLGRDTLEGIYRDVFRTESALVRPQIISGTHALTVALFGNLKHGDELISVSGEPYDTLRGVIGTRRTKGSLIEHGILYKQVDLLRNSTIDFEGIKETVSPKTKMVAIQRSKGYSFRDSLSVETIAELISFIKNINKNIICMVDNCYGEFVEFSEPSEFGADIIAGSLIKNPGGGLSPVGGYIAGKDEYIGNAAIRLTSGGLGKEVGPTLGITPLMAQGLFHAPNVVLGAVKGAVFASFAFDKLGYDVNPLPNGKRTDIVQAVNMRSPDEIAAFCKGIQAAAPVDSFVTPEPWDMPGYGCDVIMAAGAFVQGSSIELSADAPVRPPYTVFLQGGLTWYHAKLGVVMALNELYKKGFITDSHLRVTANA